MSKDMILKVIVPAELIGKCLQGGVASVLDSCVVSVFDTEPMTDTTPKPVVLSEQDKPRTKRRMIKFICPDCGKLNFAMVEQDNKKYKMSCIGCKLDYEFTDMDLVRVEYTCPACTEDRFFFTPYMEGMGANEDRCKCGNTVKLKLDMRSGEYYVAD